MILKIAKKGFTVLESIVAIAVVSLAIAGAFSAVRTGLSASSAAKEQTKAYYLAQEAIEILRNKRDSNGLNRFINGSSVSWRAGISEPGDQCAPGGICRLDATAMEGAFAAYCGIDTGDNWNVCPPLHQDGTTFVYNYSGSITTNYVREIKIENIGDDEMVVTIRIAWSHAGTPREFKTKTILTNWF